MNYVRNEKMPKYGDELCEEWKMPKYGDGEEMESVGGGERRGKYKLKK
jgi:hypothetical protein